MSTNTHVLKRMDTSDSCTSATNASDNVHSREAKITLHSHVPKQRSRVFGKTFDVTPDTPLPPKIPKTDKEKEFLLGALQHNFIFSALEENEMNLLIDVFQKQESEEGTTLIRQGDVGDYFYIVDEGKVAFLVDDGQVVGYCTRGGSFGELALLYDAPRAATCIVESESCTLWKVDQNTFRFSLAKVAQTQTRKTSQILQKVPLFQKLKLPMLEKFSDALTRVQFKTGERIVNKGDIGEIFYLIEDGEVRVHDVGYGVEMADTIIGAGQWFGERALLTGEPRAASVTAVGDVVTFAMNRETFEEVFGSLEDVLCHEMKKDCLEVLPIIAHSNILSTEMDQLVEKMTVHTYQKGDQPVKAGEKFPQQVMMLQKGRFSVSSSSGEIHVLQSGDAYGGRFLLNEDPNYISEDTVVCDEPTECFVLTREDFESVIGDIGRLGTAAKYVSKSIQTDIQLQDVTKHRVLGKGAFGLVWLVTHKDNTSEPYALKCMNKRILLEADMVTSIVREKDILSSIDHPFILPMIASFQDTKHAYLLLKLFLGGELFYVIHSNSKTSLRKKKHKGLYDEDAVFYCACVLDALSHFHHRMICYRDLKPENILIDSKGYCIIVDLGFAKIVANTKTHTLCGTPDYLAPEILLSKGHDTAVDWWAFGVLIYEMVVGKSPFPEPGKDQMAMFKNIVHERYTIPEQSNVSEDAKHLISRLLQKNISSRLGCLARGYLDIRDHPWFAKMDFQQLLKRELDAPWLPEVKDAMDAHHFKPVKENSDDNDGEDDEKELTPEEQEQFDSF